jgi:hypothetical protein
MVGCLVWSVERQTRTDTTDLTGVLAAASVHKQRSTSTAKQTQSNGLEFWCGHFFAELLVRRDDSAAGLGRALFAAQPHEQYAHGLTIFTGLTLNA